MQNKIQFDRRSTTHKNFMPLLTHEDAWKRMYNIHGSNMASSVYSRLFIPFRWFTSPLGLCREPVQGGKFQKSKKRGLIFSVKLQQNYKEKNMTTTINCYLNTT